MSDVKDKPYKRMRGNSLLCATVAILADINLYAATVVELIKIFISKRTVLMHLWESLKLVLSIKLLKYIQMLTRLERFCARRRLGNEWKLEVTLVLA